MAGARDASGIIGRVARARKYHLVEVIHYGGNLICHVRLENDVVGSGNNLIGLSRVEALDRKWHRREISAVRSLFTGSVSRSVKYLSHRDHAGHRKKDSPSNRRPY